jgi:hypothetical protein
MLLSAVWAIAFVLISVYHEKVPMSTKKRNAHLSVSRNFALIQNQA